MVGPRITATVNPRIKSLEQAFKLTGGDMRRMLTQVDKTFRKDEKRQFATEGASGGRKWKALATATKKQKARLRKRGKRASSKIMQRTGNLRKGLSTKSHPDHVARYQLSVFGARIGVGTTNKVAMWHGALKGGDRMNPRLPRRNVMQMTVRQNRGYTKIVQDYLIFTKLARMRRALQAGAAAMKR